MQEYIVKISNKTGEATEHKCHNLSAVYGFLCGGVPAFRTRYQNFTRFKAWWKVVRQRGPEIKKTFADTVVVITL